jgi:hypothetical protein
LICAAKQLGKTSKKTVVFKYNKITQQENTTARGWKKI